MTSAGDASAQVVLRTLSQLLSSGGLPDPLPIDPMPIVASWFEDAKRSGKYEDFNAMTLATATREGAPSARTVLCKQVEQNPPAVVFFTNYESRKGRELEANPLAAVLFHWPHAGRQVRIEGSVVRTGAAESDAYFRSRSLVSRIGACASAQSRALASREELIGRAIGVARDALARGGEIERPANWGGYRLVAASVELWISATGRLHDRVCWTRSGAGNAWTATRMNP